LVTATCYIISGDECSKKGEEKRYEEIKRASARNLERKKK